MGKKVNLILNKRFIRRIFLSHQSRVSEVINAILLPLNPSITNLAYFFTIVFSPLFVIEFLYEIFDTLRTDQIYERKSDIALIFEIDREIKKIEFSLKFSINLF